MLLCSYVDAAVNQLNANTNATVSNLSHNAPIPPPYQRLRDELMQFATELRKKCNVSVHTKFLFVFLSLLFIFLHMCKIINILNAVSSHYSDAL